MSSYNLNTLVSTNEQEALKEMIFKRARERAQSLTDETQASYTTAVQNDVMDLARETFVSKQNPFSIIETTEACSSKDNRDEEIGFAKRRVKEIKSHINNSYQNKTNEIVNTEVVSTMNDARADFNTKSSFMGALEFLNSQASISLIKAKGKSFEALA